MRSAIGKRQIVLLEGMCHGTMRQRAGRRTNSRSGAEYAALAALPHALRLRNDHLAPRKLSPKQDDGHRVRYAIFGTLQNVRRNLLIAKSNCVLREADGLPCL